MGMNPRLLRPTPTGFDPRRIANLTGWWDFSDAATVTTASGAVSGVSDKSGNGHTATQGNVNNRPTYQLAARNAKNVARFDGLNDFLASSLTFANSPFTIFTVFAINSSKFCAFVAEVRPTFTGYFGATVSASNLMSISKVGVSGAFSTLGVTNNTVAVGVYTSAGISGGNISATVRRNGEQNASALSLTTVPTDATGLNLGSGNNGAADQLNGDIGEVLLYGRQLSATEIAAVERALAKKWGVTLA
jgi:hypothetical protein